jgi:uncharacterized membrane protein
VPAQAAIALDLALPAARPVLALVTFVVLPTLVLYRRAGLPGDSAVARLQYAFGASVLGLLVGGLLLNTGLPLVGVDRPLAPAPLALAWLIVDLALLRWRASVPLFSPWSPAAAARRALGARWEPAQAAAVLATLLAVVGAVRLNNGAGGAVALTAHAAAALALLALLVRPSGTLGRDARTLALVGTSLLLATSLRGWNITGHDIQAEFLAFQLTNDGQHWRMGALQSAYNACLSVNILPTVLAQATGLSGQVVFKVLLQLVFAVVPVLTFLLSRRFAGRHLGLVAATFTIAFPTFFTDMPYLVRQQVAFFFLALMLLAATEPTARTSPRRARALVAIFGTGVVLSHYSTTYLMLMALVLALLGVAAATALARVRRRAPRTTAPPPLVLLNPFVVLFLVIATLAWTGPVTHSGGHASSVVRQTWDALRGRGADEPASSDTSYWLFSRDTTTPRERMDRFVEETLRYRDEEIPPGERLVAHPAGPELRPRLFPASTAPVTSVGSGLKSVGLDPVIVNKALKLLSAAAMQAFLLLGLLWLLRRATRSTSPRDRPRWRPSREELFTTCGAVATLALVVLVPNLSVDYGVLRAFQQTLLVVAPVMAAGLWLGARPAGARARLVTTAVPVALLLVLSGVLPSALGGQQERIALANSGNYYDRFYATDPEARAISWLVAAERAEPSVQRIIANRNVNVRLLAASRNTAPVSDRLFPTLLTKDSYVFVDGQIIDEGVSTVFYTGDLLTYAYPLSDLDRRLDLVYSAPGARVYR